MLLTAPGRVPVPGFASARPVLPIGRVGRIGEGDGSTTPTGVGTRERAFPITGAGRILDSEMAFPVVSTLPVSLPGWLGENRCRWFSG
jgi:hypothetical protein